MSLGDHSSCASASGCANGRGGGYSNCVSSLGDLHESEGYDKFEAFAKRGKPIDAFKVPDGVDRKVAQQNFQKGDIERSIAYCRKIGLGRDR